MLQTHDPKTSLAGQRQHEKTKSLQAARSEFVLKRSELCDVEMGHTVLSLARVK